MGLFSKLFKGKEAFQAVDLDDIYFPISDEQREQLQQIIYGMYRDIQITSEKHGLTPFLVGGSALGAVRHKGFIPWDDDLDIGFIREEYEEFIEAFREDYNEKYFVNAPGKQKRTRARFTKILLKGTIFREMISLPEDEYNGVFVDVFPIDRVPNNAFRRKIKGLNVDILAYISSQVFNRENRTPDSIQSFKRIGKANYYIRMAIGFVFGFHKSSWWFKKFDKESQWNHTNNSYYTIAAGRKHYFGELLKAEMVLPARYVPFESGVAPVFCDVEGYLSQMYGDFMRIPPEEKRERHYIKELKI